MLGLLSYSSSADIIVIKLSYHLKISSMVNESKDIILFLQVYNFY